MALGTRASFYVLLLKNLAIEGANGSTTNGGFCSTMSVTVEQESVV